MNRTTKFRAWDKAKKIFVPIRNIAFKDGRVLMINANSGFKTKEKVFIENLKLLQFTGLKDKNGVEIYEGDIVARIVDEYNEITIDVGGEYEQVGSNWTQSVKWNKEKASFCIWASLVNGDNEYEDYWEDEYPDWEDVEVIGNIYQDKK